MNPRILLAALLLASLPALSQAPATAPKPRVVALVAAMGSEFTLVHEVEGVGSNRTPFRRETVQIPDNLLNKLVLGSLDKSIAKSDPASERTFVALNPPVNKRGMPRGAILIDWVREQLAKMPQRAQWDSVLVATPGYRSAARERLPSRISGMGIFAQPLCQSDPTSCDRGWTPDVGGVDAVTPEGEQIRANQFVAPYSLVEITVLDPKTLEVIDRGESVEHTKMFDPKSDSINNMFTNVDKGVMAERIVALVERSVAAAVAETERKGKVDVKERGEVKPAK